MKTPRLHVIKGNDDAIPDHKRPVMLLSVIRRNFNYSHQQFANVVGISKHALIRCEQGTYNEILPKLMEWMLNNTTYSELLLRDSYEDYQIKTRALHRAYFGSSLSTHITPGCSHPLRQLRGNRNLAQVAKDLCLPYSTLAYFERNFKQQKSVPKNLVNVLKEIGYSDADIKDFKLAYDQYRTNMGCTPVGTSNAAVI